MSIDSCKHCGMYVDTDYDCETYYITTDEGQEIELDYCLCERCREKPDVIEGVLQQGKAHERDRISTTDGTGNREAG